MRIKRIQFDEGVRLGVLSGFRHDFLPSDRESKGVEPICFIGDNGSGKSKLLECLVEIFHTLDLRYRSFESNVKARIPFTFELEYSVHVRGDELSVIVRNRDLSKDAEVFLISEDGVEMLVANSQEILDLMPQYVVGYTSGENETLSVPFLADRQVFSDSLSKAALTDSADEAPDSRLVMMDYDLNLSVIAACFLLASPPEIEVFADSIRASDLHSFRLNVRFNHHAASRFGGVKRTSQIDRYVENFRKCATCWDYNSSEQTWTFDFLVNQETKVAFGKYYLSPYALFRALQRLEMLNDLMIPKKVRDQEKKNRLAQKVVLRPPVPSEEDRVFRFEALRLKLKQVSKPVDYIDLSDGEHQFLHVFGSLMIFDQESILFVFDEPESHFNPKWRIEFVSTLNRIIKGDKHCMLLTTHAPFVPSDIRRSNVYIFRRGEGGNIVIRSPSEETYGASFSNILADVFGIKPPPISKVSLQDLQELQRSEDPDEIEKRLPNFGDSMEKFALLERIEVLREEAEQGT